MIANIPDNTMDYSRYVDKEISINLDSSDAFEGPEKLLEIWFAPSADSLPFEMHRNGLRSIPRKQWDKVLDLVQCKVLSVVSTDNLDSYVLSESSMFVFPHRLILKTCGTTTLINGITEMLELIEEYAGFSRTKQPWRVFYSRKSFMFPKMQKHPHSSWKSEVCSLDSLFANGKSYIVGNVMADHWYLYCTMPTKSSLEFPNSDRNPGFADQNLELLMTDLCPVRCEDFFTNRLPGTEAPSEVGAPADDEDPGHELGNKITKLAGVDQVYPTRKQIVDSFCFTPCGYSCNGLVTEHDYFTIHVTPESHCSYASFESTVDPAVFGMTNLDVISKVVKIFRPGKFVAVFFQSKDENKCQKSWYLPGYKRLDNIVYDVFDYTMIYSCFEKVRQ